MNPKQSLRWASGNEGSASLRRAVISAELSGSDVDSSGTSVNSSSAAEASAVRDEGARSPTPGRLHRPRRGLVRVEERWPRRHDAREQTRLPSSSQACRLLQKDVFGFLKAFPSSFQEKHVPGRGYLARPCQHLVFALKTKASQLSRSKSLPSANHEFRILQKGARNPLIFGAGTSTASCNICGRGSHAMLQSYTYM